MIAFASGKHALGLCDRCGFQYKLPALKETIVRRKKTGLLVCPECWEADHPQNMQGAFKVSDPQALKNPRTDTGKAQSEGLFGWNPVFVPAPQMVQGIVRAA